MRKLLFFFGFVVMLIVGTYVLAINMDWSIYKEEIQAEVRNYSGRELEISGPIRLQIFPTPSLRMESISLSDPSRKNAPALATADEAFFSIELKPFLFHRQLRFSDARLRGVILTIETTDNEISNLYFDPRPASANPRTIEIENGTLLIKRPVGDMTYKINSALISAPSFNGPYRVNANLLTNSGYVIFTGSLGVLSRETASPLEFSMKHQTNDFLMSFNGSFERLNRFSGALKVTAKNFQDFLKVFSADFFAFSDVTLEAQIDAIPDKVSVRSINGTFDGTTVSGNIVKDKKSVQINVSLGKMKDTDFFAHATTLMDMFKVVTLNTTIDEISGPKGSFKDIIVSGSLIDRQFATEKVTGKLTAGEADFSYSGVVDFKNDVKVTGNISLTGKDFTSFQLWIPGLPLALRNVSGDTFSLTGMLSREKGATTLSDMALKKDDATFKGRIFFEKEKLSADLAVEGIQIKGDIDAASWRQGLTDIFSPLLPFSKISSNINLTLSDCTYKGLFIGHMTLVLSTKEETVTLQKCEGNLGGINISAKGKINNTSDGLLFTDFSFQTIHRKENETVLSFAKKYAIPLPIYDVFRTKGSFSGPLSNLVLNVSLSKDGDDQLSLDGKLTETSGFDGKFVLQLDRANTLFDYVFKPAFTLFKTSLKASGIYKDKTVSDLSFQLGETEGTGQLSKRDERVTGLLNFSVLAMKDILPSFSFGLLDQEKNDDKIDFSSLGDTVLDISIRSASMLLNEREITAFRTSLFASKDGIDLKSVDGRIGIAGKVKGDIKHQSDGKGSAILNLSNVAFSSLFNSAHLDALNGTLNAIVNISALGHSKSDIIANLSGNIKLNLDQFILSGLTLDPLQPSQPHIVSGRTPVDHFSADLIFTPGRLSIGDNRMEASGLSAFVSGDVNLSDRSFDATLQVTPAGFSPYQIFLTDSSKRTDAVRSLYDPGFVQAEKEKPKTAVKHDLQDGLVVVDDFYDASFDQPVYDSPFAPQVLDLLSETALIEGEAGRFSTAKGFKDLMRLIEEQKTAADHILYAGDDDGVLHLYNAMIQRMALIRTDASHVISLGLMDKIDLLINQSEMLLVMIEREVRKDSSRLLPIYVEAEELNAVNQKQRKAKKEAKVIQDLKEAERILLLNNARMFELYRTLVPDKK